MKRRKEQFLLFRIKAFKDEHAFAALLQEHGPALQRFLHFKLPTKQDAEDAYSTSCIRVWGYASRSKVDHFSGLIYTVARTVVADFYRSSEKKDALQTSDQELAQVESKHSGKKIEEFVDGELMKNALMQLSENEREAIVMRYLEGHQVKEVAIQIGKSENATSVLLHRALKKVRTILEN